MEICYLNTDIFLLSVVIIISNCSNAAIIAIKPAWVDVEAKVDVVSVKVLVVVVVVVVVVDTVGIAVLFK